MSAILINPFEVPEGEDEAFISEWEEARDFLRERDAYEETRLHRSLAAEADYRFVNVATLSASGGWPEAIADPDFPGRRMSFTGHPAVYEVVSEDWPDGDEGIVLINAFEVPVEADDDFIAGWERARDALRAQPGYIATRLHRSIAPNADFRFVNIARWESPQAFGTALQAPAFQAAAQSIRHPSHPALYEVVRT
jgi:heme-degrading monooxygenase HmoA